MLKTVSSKLKTAEFGQSLTYFDHIDSTNRWMRENVTDLPQGAVAIAEYQTAGKGRLDRQWVAPAGSSILHSILIKPPWGVEQAPWLTMIAGLATRHALHSASGLAVQLKWPNDVVVQLDPQSRTLYKLGGILSEIEQTEGKLRYGIIGIGLNINTEATDLPTPASTTVLPASLFTLSGKRYDRAEIIADLLFAFETGYHQALNHGSPLAAWRNELVTLGQPVTVTEKGNPTARSWEGTAIDVDEWGRLIVETNDGNQKSVAAGDVTLRQTL